MTSTGYKRKFRTRDRFLQIPRAVEGKNLAFYFLHDQSGTENLFHLGSKFLLHLFDVYWTVPFAEVSIVLPGPLTTGQLLQVVDTGELADDFERAAWVEVVDNRRGFVEILKLAIV